MATDSNVPARQLLVGCLTLFIIGTDLFVVSPLIPEIAERFGVNAATAGWMVTAFSLVYMVCAPFLGTVSDRLGRRKVIVTGLVLFVGANLLTGYVPSFAWLLASRMIAGLAAAMVSPSIYAITGDVAPPAKRATSLALVGLGLLIALSVGAPLGSLLSTLIGYEGVFLVIAGSSLLLAFANGIVWRGAGGARNVAAAHVDLSLAVLLRAVGPTVLWSTAVFGVYTYLGSGLRTAAHLSVVQVSGVVAAYGIGAAVGSLSGGRLADRFGAKSAATFAVASLAFTFVLVRLLLSSPGPLFVGFALVGVLSQAFFPAQQARLAGEFPKQRGALMAWNNSALYLGIFIGSLAGGRVFINAGFPTLLLACAGVGLVGALVNTLLVASPVSVAAPAPVPMSGARDA